MRFALAADPAVQKSLAGAAGVATGAASWAAIAQEWALQLFGVPLPVVLAAAAGAFLARTFLHDGQPGRSAGSFIAWLLVGAVGADLAHAAIAGWLGHPLPTGAVAFCAAAVALGGSLLLTRETVEKARAAVGRWLDGKWRHPGGGNDGGA